jgi:hypothetical protein
MKLTWFGGTTFRIHIGGQMIVVDREGAPERIDSAELVSGADQIVDLADAFLQIDPRKWSPRRVEALIDEGATMPGVVVHRLAATAVLIEAAGEPPLVIATGDVPEAGRWGREAVVVIAGRNLPRTAASVVNEIGPRLIAIAGGEHVIEDTIAAVRDLLEDTGLMAMEPALALEV